MTHIQLQQAAGRRLLVAIKRGAAAFVCALFASCLCTGAYAQTYPNKPVRLVVG